MIPKFRVWDKLLKQMYYPEDFKITFNRGETVISTERELGWVDWEEKHINKDIFLMQSTGLKDKNGVEIYEGDIINCKHGICEVKYILDSYHAVKGNQSGLLGWVCDGETKIIGNVYENPELLEED